MAAWYKRTYNISDSDFERLVHDPLLYNYYIDANNLKEDMVEISPEIIIAYLEGKYKDYSLIDGYVAEIFDILLEDGVEHQHTESFCLELTKIDSVNSAKIGTITTLKIIRSKNTAYYCFKDMVEKYGESLEELPHDKIVPILSILAGSISPEFEKYYKILSPKLDNTSINQLFYKLATKYNIRVEEILDVIPLSEITNETFIKIWEAIGVSKDNELPVNPDVSSYIFKYVRISRRSVVNDLFLIMVDPNSDLNNYPWTTIAYLDIEIKENPEVPQNIVNGFFFYHVRSSSYRCGDESFYEARLNQDVLVESLRYAPPSMKDSDIDCLLEKIKIKGPIIGVPISLLISVEENSPNKYVREKIRELRTTSFANLRRLIISARKTLGPFQTNSTEWMELCRFISDDDINKLRQIAKDAGIKSVRRRTSESVPIDRATKEDLYSKLDGFTVDQLRSFAKIKFIRTPTRIPVSKASRDELYKLPIFALRRLAKSAGVTSVRHFKNISIDNASKRELCAQLAISYEKLRKDNVEVFGCDQDTTIVLADDINDLDPSQIVVDDKNHCFSIDEVEQLMGYGLPHPLTKQPLENVKSGVTNPKTGELYSFLELYHIQKEKFSKVQPSKVHKVIERERLISVEAQRKKKLVDTVLEWEEESPYFPVNQMIEMGKGNDKTEIKKLIGYINRIEGIVLSPDESRKIIMKISNYDSMRELLNIMGEKVDKKVGGQYMIQYFAQE